MGSRHFLSFEVDNGLLTPPTSPTVHAHASLRTIPQCTATIRVVTGLAEVSNSRHVPVPRTNHARSCSTLSRSLHGKEDSFSNAPRKSENAPPGFDGQEDGVQGKVPEAQVSKTRNFLRKLRGSKESFRIGRGSSSSRSSRSGQRSSDSSGPSNATWSTCSDLIDLSSPATEHVEELPQSMSKPWETASKESPREAIIPKLPCFLGNSNLDQRLRPSRRPYGSPSPIKAKPDRFIIARRPSGAARNSLLLGKPPAMLTDRQRQLRRRTGLSDPFTPPRPGSRHVNSSESSYTQRLARTGHFRGARVLGLRQDSPSNTNRQPSTGAVWTMGGQASVGETNSHTSLASLNPPVYSSNFFVRPTSGDDAALYENRLALAFDIDQARRVMGLTGDDSLPSTPLTPGVNMGGTMGNYFNGIVWKNNGWVREGALQSPRIPQAQKRGAVPAIAFKYVILLLLEAPDLRDDFYCSVLAYSPTARRLAVGLGSKVYLWSETFGVSNPPRELDYSQSRQSYVTSLAFSSVQGGHAILAIGRGDGRITMYSPLDTKARYLRMILPSAAAHVCFRPTTTRRPSQRHPAYLADNEVFLVGDETGLVSVFLVEWPNEKDRELFVWHGSIILHARVAVHTQQICGIAWSSDGEFFATGGNDNLCCLFQASKVLAAERQTQPADLHVRQDEQNNTFLDVAPRQFTDIMFGPADMKHQWRLNAAVKAIAFCPWQRGLIAAGGGSNDRCIHFFHTISGTCLAKIDCAAQVTSLVWSTSRREIVATFGFAQPEHPFRIAVYSWPSCQQVVAIPWHDEMRALYAIPYPCGPSVSGAVSGRSRESEWSSRRGENRCIVVAASDGSIKFHEIWSESRKAIGPGHGLLGGSDILEGLHGIDKDSVDTIR